MLVFMNYAGAMPLLQAEWGLSNAQSGAIQSAGQFGYVIAVLIVSSLADYIDAKKIIVSGAVWAGVFNLLFAGFAYDTGSASVLRMMIGLGIAGIYMPGLKLISQKIPSDQRGRAVGLFVASFTLASGISITLSGNLASILGWRVAFGLASLGPLLGALASWRLLPRSVPETKSVEGSRPMKDLVHNRQAVAVILIYVFHAWEVLGLRSWLTAYLTSVRINEGASLAEAIRAGATMAGLATLLAAFATASIGAISDRTDRLRAIIRVTATSFVFVMALGFSLNYPWLLVILVSLGAVFMTNADSAVISTKLTEVVPGDYLGRTLAVYSFLGFAAGSISPLVFGAVLDIAGDIDRLGAPWSLAFATLAIGSLAGLLIAIGLRRREKVMEKPVE